MGQRALPAAIHSLCIRSKPRIEFDSDNFAKADFGCQQECTTLAASDIDESVFSELVRWIARLPTGQNVMQSRRWNCGVALNEAIAGMAGGKSPAGDEAACVGTVFEIERVADEAAVLDGPLQLGQGRTHSPAPRVGSGNVACTRARASSRAVIEPSSCASSAKESIGLNCGEGR